MDTNHDAKDPRLTAGRRPAEPPEEKPFAKRLAVLLALGVLVLLILSAVLPKSRPVSSLERSDTEDRTESLTVTGTYGDVAETRDVTFTVNRRAETPEELAARLDAFLDVLPERILGNNASSDHIFVNLELPERDGDIRIEWTSERPDIIDAEGTLHPESIGESPVTFHLTAEATLGEETRERTIPVTVSRPLTEAEKKRYLSMRMDDWTLWAVGEPAETSVRLETETADGIGLAWERKRAAFAVPALLVLLAGALLVREERNAKRKRRERAERRAIEDAFPAFLDELVLYLNAGLVLHSAVLRIAETASRGETNDPLREAVRRICSDAEEKNQPVRTGFRLFAHETRIPQLLRFSSILDDAVLKGVDIVSKLEIESLLIRNGALRTAEEKGRKAETKLAFPMVLLLSALLLVTLAPVLLEMGG